MTGRNTARVLALKPSACPRHRRLPVGCARRRGFSLIEIMIAIVILGLGLVMVASMFPVAWKRARQLSEHTVHNAVVESAHTTVALLARVASSEYLEGAGPSFMGDLVLDPTATGDFGNGYLLLAADTRVHLLHLENVQLPAPGGGSPLWHFIPESPYLLELAGVTACLPGDPPELPDGYEEYQARSFLNPQVRFHQRLYPPLPARVKVGSDGSFTPGSPTQDPRWDELLGECGYCWAAFHRLRADPNTPFGPQMDPPCVPTFGKEDLELAVEYVDKTRFYDMYYVTLRRPQASHRYAQQNVATAPDPFDVNAPFVTPEALGPDFDCVLPVPWRVQVYFPFQQNVRDNISIYEETGIPTEIEVNTSKARTALIVVEMFQKGAYFIDEITGKVFRVTRARVNDASGTPEAYVTLDREVLPGELDLPEHYRGWDPVEHMPGQLKAPDVNRTVWVFPPPVAPRADASKPLIFSGPQPVVGVDIRTLTVSP